MFWIYITINALYCLRKKIERYGYGPLHLTWIRQEVIQIHNINKAKERRKKKGKGAPFHHRKRTLANL